MGATTFQIGDTEFGALSTADGKYALYFKAAAEIHKINRFHPPGTSGNILIFDGRIGKKITVMGRYVGDRETILAAWKTDADSWVGQPIDITDDIGFVYERCVMDAPAEMIGKGTTGDGNEHGFFDFIAVFSWEG